MSAEFGPVLLQRGLHLLRVRRYVEAEAAFKDVLQGDPENDEALHQLAICIWYQTGRQKEALATIEQAVRAAPGVSGHHALKAIMVGSVHSIDFAMGPANEAIRLDPTSPYAWYVRAKLHLDARKLPKAEADARKALEYDPNHDASANILSHALRMQGKMAENASQLAGMLARNPEDEGNHTAAGWNALQLGKYEDAQKHFREALRLDPQSEFARNGLIESFKARSRLYRLYLRWALWMSAKSKQMQWGVILGLYIFMRFSAQFLHGPFAPVAIFILVAYFIFVLWGHIARGMGNFLLLCDRFARHALRPMERVEGWVVGLCVISSVLLGATGAIISNLVLLWLAGTLLAAAIPLSHTFCNSSKIGRFVFGAIGGFALLAALLLVVAPWVPSSWMSGEDVENTVYAACITALLSTWLANFAVFRK